MDEVAVGTCKIKFRPESMGDGSGRILRRSSQLWLIEIECSKMNSAELREGEESLKLRDQRLKLAYLKDPFFIDEA